MVIKRFLMILAIMTGAAVAAPHNALAGAGVNAGTGTCASIKPAETEVNINFIASEPHYDFSMSRKEINKNMRGNIDAWLARNNMQNIWYADDMEIGGYAAAGGGIVTSAEPTYKSVDSYGVYYCIYFKKIDIEVFYRTEIVIPSDIKRGTCEFEIVLEHEQRHDQANESAFREYIERLRGDILDIVTVMEDEYVSKETVQAHSQNMKDGLRDMMQVYIMESPQEKMRILNHNIDTPEEYASFHVKVKECKERRAAELR